MSNAHWTTRLHLDDSLRRRQVFVIRRPGHKVCARIVWIESDLCGACGKSIFGSPRMKHNDKWCHVECISVYVELG